MGSLYVTGGQQRHARSMSEREPYWYKYHKGLIIEVDPQTGCREPRLEYISPPEVCPEDDPPILFKSGTLQDGKLYVCTQTELLIYSVPDFQMVARVSLPCFNDVHHVRPTPDGHLLIANTGLDMVLEVTLEGEVLREWSAVGGDPWSEYSKSVDYRRVGSMKPYRAHPNYVFYVGNDIWATRFEQKDAICLTDPAKRIEIGIELVHDGLVHDDHIYFTTVNACIVVVNAQTLVTEEVIDLNEMAPENTVLGWCRGILVDGDNAWVGFSRIRLTKFRENLSWIRRSLKDHGPTRIACYDLINKRCLTEIDLQSAGLDSVFSILRVPGRSDIDLSQPQSAG